MPSSTTEDPATSRPYTESTRIKNPLRVEEEYIMIPSLKRLVIKMSVLFSIGAIVVFSGSTAEAQQLNLADAPLFLTQNPPPLNLLVLGRDHKLYYEAYNDYGSPGE
jgi:hypothetical protein